MRVDTAAGEAHFGDLDALTRLKGYLSAVRRRWYLVLVPVLVGAALGWFSGPGSDTALVLGRTQYYRASHVLIDESTSTDPQTGQVVGQPTNLAQAAYLVNTGEVPTRVATTLGLPLEKVTSSVIGLPRTQVSSVEVQALGTSRGEVVRLADTSAGELLKSLAAQAKTDADQQRDRILGQIDKLDADISGLNGRIAAGPADRAQLEAQLRSLTNQYSLAYEQFSQLANRPPPSAGLASLKDAKAVSIPKATYDRAKETIRDGADYVTGQTPTTVPDGGGSSEPGPGASRSTRAELGGLTGLAIGLGLVLLLDRFDSRLRRRSEVEAATGATVVAEIPPLKRHQQKSREVMAETQHRSRAAEAYRVIRGSVLFALAAGDGDAPAPGDGAAVVMVTSPSPSEGKTTTVANLAAVFAEGGFSVLVINCDFRRPQVHKYLVARSGNEELGLPDPEEGRSQVGQVVVSDTSIARVRLITGLGEDDPDANPLEVVALQRRIVEAARSRFDMILLDTAPFLTTNDASELLSETDQVLLVVRGGRTTVEAASRTATILGRFNAPIVGVVMNDSDDAPAADYYYSYVKDKPKRGRRGGNASSSKATDLPAADTDPGNGARAAASSTRTR